MQTWRATLPACVGESESGSIKKGLPRADGRGSRNWSRGLAGNVLADECIESPLPPAAHAGGELPLHGLGERRTPQSQVDFALFTPPGSGRRVGGDDPRMSTSSK